MPVTVRVPIRVEVDPLALALGLDELIGALDSALDRALLASNRAVLEPRGGYHAVALQAPDFTWTGDGADDLGRDARDAFEELLRDRIARSCERASLDENTRRRSGLRAPLGDTPSETFDPSRYDSVLEFYDLPTYDRRGKQRPAPLRTDHHDEVVQVVRHAWIPGPRLGKFGNAWYARLTQLYAEAARQFPDPPVAEFAGIIQELSDGTFEVYFESPDRKQYHNFIFTPQPSRKLDAEGNYKNVGIRSSPVGIAHLQRVTAVGKSHAERLAALTTVEGPFVRAELRKLATKSRVVSEAEFEAALDARVEREMRIRERGFSPDAVAIGQLTIGGLHVILSLPEGANFDWQGTAVLLPVSATIHSTDAKLETDGVGGDGTTDSTAGGLGAKGRGRSAIIDFGGLAAPGTSVDGKALFPGVSWGDTYTDVCESFLNEPSLDDLGEAGAALRESILEIATDLDIPPCMYAGHFAIQAASAINRRASTVAEYSAALAHTAVLHPGLGEWSDAAGKFLNPLDSNSRANLGTIHFRPTVSPALQFLRHVAGVVPKLARLSIDLYRLYERYPQTISGAYSGNAHGWSFHFFYRFQSTMVQSAGLVFGQTCRVLFLQLLWTSRDAIRGHQANEPAYVATFKQVILPQLVRVDALMALQRNLDNQIDLETNPYVSEDGYSSAAPDPTPDMITNGGYTVAIKDAEGHVWTSDQLARSIALRRGVAEDIDPLVKQFTDLPDVMRSIRANEDGVAEVVHDTLASMYEHNSEQINEATDSWLYAFRAGKIREGLPSERTGGIDYVLQGIHLQAHQQISEFFDNAYYADGVNALFSGVAAWGSFTSFIEFAGIVLLAVVCPPAAAVAGVIAAGYHLYEAHKRESLYGALLNPDELVSFAEIEAEVFAARLGLALAFIPDAVTIVRGGIVGVRVALEEGVITGVRAGAKSVVLHVAEEAVTAMQQALRKGLIQSFVSECVKAEFINLLLERALAPALDGIVAEIDRTGPVGGLSGAQQVFARLNARKGAKK